MSSLAAANNRHLGASSRQPGRDNKSARPRRGQAWVEGAALILIALLLVGGVVLTSSRPDVRALRVRIHVDSGTLCGRSLNGTQ